MFGSTLSVVGQPRILLVDTSGNREGWESGFCDHLFTALQRRGVGLSSAAPLQISQPGELASQVESQEAFNCILLCCHGAVEQGIQGTELRSYWQWLDSHLAPSSKLFAACTWESYDPVASREILEAQESFAPLALVPKSPLTAREAFLFFLKFFGELDLHSQESMTGRMVSFSYLKARELLRKRHLSGEVGVRC